MNYLLTRYSQLWIQNFFLNCCFLIIGDRVKESFFNIASDIVYPWNLFLLYSALTMGMKSLNRLRFWGGKKPSEKSPGYGKLFCYWMYDPEILRRKTTRLAWARLWQKFQRNHLCRSLGIVCTKLKKFKSLMFP